MSYKSKFMKSETFLLSIPALAVDWNRPEEDKAWASLQTPMKNTRIKTKSKK